MQAAGRRVVGNDSFGPRRLKTLARLPAAAAAAAAAVAHRHFAVPACNIRTNATVSSSGKHEARPNLGAMGGLTLPCRPGRCSAVEGAAGAGAGAGPAAAAPEGVQVSKTDLSPTLRQLVLRVPPSMCLESFHTAVEEIKQTVMERKGLPKADISLPMLVAEFGGQRNFKISVIEDILSTAMPAAMQLTGERVVPGSERISSNINDLEGAFDPTLPLEIEIEYEALPEVKWSQPYKEAELRVKDSGNASTDKEAVEALIRQFLKQRGGSQQVVERRGLQMGDTCLMDIDVRARGSKQSLPGMKKTQFPFDTELDPLGLFKGMQGMRPGEVRSFPLQIPSDYPVELWQDMHTDVQVQVQQLYQWMLPEFNDDFVRSHFSQYPSAQGMRSAMLADTALERIKELDKQMEARLMDLVLSCMDVPEVPESMVLDMGGIQYRNHLINMTQQELASKEELQELAEEQKFEQYIEENKKELEDMVRFKLAVEHIFQEEGLAVPEEELRSTTKAQAQMYEEEDIEYDPELLQERVLESFKTFQVMEWLKDNIRHHIQPFNTDTGPAAQGQATGGAGPGQQAGGPAPLMNPSNPLAPPRP